MNNLWIAHRSETYPPLVGEKLNFVHRGEGQPVLMIHGLAASLHDWDDFLPSISEAGFSGYAIDLLGHGESAKPKNLNAYTAENAFWHWVRWWEKEVPPRGQILIGHSLGGYMVMEYALRFPERLSAIVLINPFYSLSQLPSPVQKVLRYPLKNTILIERIPYWLFRMLIDLTSLRWQNGKLQHELPEHIRAQTAWDYKRASPGIYNLPRTIRNLEPELKHLHIPALVIWGGRDQTLDPQSFPYLVQALPQAEGFMLASCGHIPHQCHPQQVYARILQFLAEKQEKKEQR